MRLASAALPFAYELQIGWPVLIIIGLAIVARFLWWRFRPYTDAEYEAVWRASR